MPALQPESLRMIKTWVFLLRLGRRARFPGGQKLLLSNLKCTVKYFRPSGGTPEAQPHKCKIESYIPEGKSVTVGNVKDLPIAHGISYPNCET